MAIVDTDIKLLASQRLNDDPDGGGFMTGTVVVDGVENNLFPDISDADRTFGRVQLRKVYVAVTSEDSDTYMGAHVILDDTPDDPAATALMVTKAGYAQERADIVGALDTSNYGVAPGATKRILGGAVLSAGVTTAIQARYDPPHGTSYWNGSEYVTSVVGGELSPGDILGIFTGPKIDPIPTPGSMEVVYLASVAESGWFSVGGAMCSLTLTRPVQSSYNSNTEVVYDPYYAGGYSSSSDPNDYAVKLTQDTANGALQFYGQTTTTSNVDIGDVSLPVVTTWGQYIPVGDAGYPVVDPATLGVDPANYAPTGGRVRIFRANEALVLHHTVTSAPMTVSNGQDVNLGRTRLTKVRVFDSTGAEITTNFTPNLATGHVVFGTVSGYAQPITIQNRIEDMLLIRNALEQSIDLARAVTHNFPSGSKVSSVLMFGDLQARAHEGFDQATWTGVWSDTLIGSATTAEFYEPANPIVVTNRGAITERWACVFTNTTTFKVIGEQVGEILIGNTGSNTAPLNPATLEPYFTIPSTGWGSGWAAGNVYRFNTDGANAPVWLIRSIAPSDPFVGQDSMTVAIRGNVDA